MAEEATEEGGLFAQYLTDVPEEHRAPVEQYLKDASKGVESRLQEAAELRKTVDAYNEAGVTRYEPDDLAQYLAWREEVSTDPEKLRGWITEAAGELGMTIEQQEELAATHEAAGPDVKAELERMLEERLGPIQERFQTEDQQRQTDEIARDIETRRGVLEEQHGKLDDDTWKAVLDLGVQDETPEWVENGFARYQQMVAAAQRQFVKDKTSTPAPANTGGGYAKPAPITDWNEAYKSALNRVQQDQ